MCGYQWEVHQSLRQRVDCLLVHSLNLNYLLHSHSHCIILARPPSLPQLPRAMRKTLSRETNTPQRYPKKEMANEFFRKVGVIEGIQSSGEDDRVVDPRETS